MAYEKRFIELAEYIRRLVPDGTKQEELASKLVISQGAVSRILNGDMLPSEDIAAKMEQIWGVDGIVERVKEAKRNKTTKILNNASLPASLPTKPRLPVYAAAGSLSEYSKGVLLEQCEQVPIIHNIPDYDYTMFIKGNSMEPKYESGDEIAIKKSEVVIEWGKDYVLDTQDGIIFKKIYEEGDKIRCVSYNHDEYPDFFVPKSIIYGYYRFVGLVRV